MCQHPREGDLARVLVSIQWWQSRLLTYPADNFPEGNGIPDTCPVRYFIEFWRLIVLLSFCPVPSFPARVNLVVGIGAVVHEFKRVDARHVVLGFIGGTTLFLFGSHLESKRVYVVVFLGKPCSKQRTT